MLSHYTQGVLSHKYSGHKCIFMNHDKSYLYFAAFDINLKVTKEELDVQTALVKNLAGTGIKKIWGSTLFHKDDIPFKSDR